VQTQPIGGVALGTDAEFDMSETFVDAELLSRPEIQPTESPLPFSNSMPRLAWRVFDANSKTKLTEAGFVSSAHLLWDGEPFPPFNPSTEDGRRAQDFLTNIHLSKEGKLRFCYIHGMSTDVHASNRR
jgi:hypothetical protein